MKPPIVLLPHDPQGAVIFEAERDAICSTCGNLILELHHIGSTAIPGIAAGGIEGRHYFRRGNPQTHHVHMFAKGHAEISRHLRFRDYLRSHPDEARAYEALKRELAARFVSNTLAYSNAKADFCARIDN